MAYSRTVYKVGFDSSNLKELMRESGLSHVQISDVTGIPLSTLNFVLNGRVLPNASFLLTMSDYFGVSLDALCGREPLGEEFGKDFMSLRRGDYEGTFLHRQRVGTKEKFGEAPYPYNLLDDIVGGSGWNTNKTEDGFFSDLVTPDQEAALRYVLSLLKERERDIVRLYYEEGKTLEEVGKVYGLTRERVRQILARAVRLLRHPSRFNLIRYGLDGYERISANKLRLKALQEESAALDEMQVELAKRRVYLESELSATDYIVPQKKITSLSCLPIEEMDLSVRSFNCLRRAGCSTAQDVADLAGKGATEMLRVRNLGRRSMEEIFDKLQALSGLDYRVIALQADAEREEEALRARA